MQKIRNWNSTLFCAALPLLLGLMPGLQVGCGEDFAPPQVSLIGVLSEQSYPYCDGGEDYAWSDPHFEVGFTRIFTTEDLPEGLLGKPVIVTGWQDAGNLSEEPVSTGACPAPAQMRSDWVNSRNGIRVRRDTSASRLPITVTSVVPFEGLKLQKQGEQLRAELVNPLPQTLERVELRAHYEGCGGKPGSRSQSKSFAWLESGAAASASFPGRLAIGDDARSPYFLHSVQVVSASQDVLFDFDTVLRDKNKFSCD